MINPDPLPEYDRLAAELGDPLDSWPYIVFSLIGYNSTWN